MSNDLKTLKVDDKWSVSYDAEQNDRPLEWHRHEKLHSPFSDFNADVAMFYALKETTDRIEELEAKLNELLVVSERALMLSLKHSDFKLYAMEPMHRAIAAAKIKGEQP